MNNYLKQIVDLSSIDKEIESFAPRIESINAKLKNEEEKIEVLNSEVANIDTIIDDLQKQKRQNNAHISEFSEKVKDCQKKSALVKTEKEAQALKLEEEIAKEQLEAANDEISRLEKLETSKKDEKEDKLKQLKELTNSLDKIKSEVEKESKSVDEQMNKIYEKKQTLVIKIDKKVLSFYEKIKKWAKTSAVVPVRKQACFGCFMRIDDTTYNKILKDEEIITCPHCGRIVYKEQE